MCQGKKKPGCGGLTTTPMNTTRTGRNLEYNAKIHQTAMQTRKDMNKNDEAKTTTDTGNPCGSGVMTGYNAIRKEVIGDCTLYQGDCAVILPQLQNFDLILTDPPYGIGAAGGGGSSNEGEVKKYDGEWDNEPPPFWLFLLMADKGENSIFWGGNYFGLPPSSCWLVWDKDNTGNFADCELAWTNFNKAVRLKKYRWNGMLQENMKHKEKRVHPTQKPVPIMEWCLTHAPTAQTVCDPFMGSGTTGVACARKGLTFTGIEREPKYFDIACKRIEKAYKTRPKLFDAVEKIVPKQMDLF